ncbi:hypothetical protein [Microbacterium jejuense]|uniref:hypothetical protein n=1 Tax=Microbacterium jejuense TaxID=1263637 RepID=UPI0031E5FE58
MISDDEQIARYAYALGNVPVSVADKAYAAAFARLAAVQRQNLLDEVCAQLPVAPRAPILDDPSAFAALMRDLHARVAVVGVRDAGSFAAAFVVSPPIIAYFTTGAGSVAIDDRPLWLQELVGHETAPIDGGRMHHRPGVNTGDWYGS